MNDLDQFKIPHDPNAYHQLHWMPGQHGKGLINPDDGSVHTWPIGDFNDGEPAHRRYIMETFGRDPYHEYPGRDRESYHPFWIDPEGTVQMLTPNGPLDQVLRVDPRLAPPEDRDAWQFGKLADARTQFRALPREEQRRMWQEDPIGVERSMEWDPPGDVQHGNENIEWVPTHALKPFVEYDRRPGGNDFAGSEERWKALGEHIVNNGFRNPVWIDYNPDNGMGHLSEGNHRVQLALDHGIAAIPTRVIRSRRTSPTQIPVNFQPQPEWEDRFSPSGYHIPEYMKPSHIGLPVVPAPGVEHLGASATTAWMPGQHGKGLVEVNGKVHTWPVNGNDEQVSDDYLIGYPSHDQYKNMHRLERGIRAASEFWINPQGEVSFFQPQHVDDATKQAVQEAHPEVTLTDIRNQDAWNNGWTFGKLAALTLYHVAPTARREAIQREGLMGHEPMYRTLYSPHDPKIYDQGGQPHGNYFFEDPATADAYVASLSIPSSPEKHTYPGDVSPEHYWEHGIYPQTGGWAYVAPQDKPEGYYGWEPEQQEEWDDRNATEYDHENPEHRALLPPNLGWDVWRVNTNGLPLTTDPEEYLFEKKRGVEPLDNPWDLGDDEEGVGDTSWPRWMTHEHVEPQRLELSHHVPPWQITDDWADEAHGATEEIPTQMMHVHPRHIIPGRVPPEVRKIWGRLDWRF